MKLIILDRDGVINYDSDNYIKSVDEFIPLPRSLEAIARLNQAGYTVVVATNQSGIARGYYNEDTLTQMHAKLSSLLSEVGGEIAAIYHCPHGPDDHCDCRDALLWWQLHPGAPHAAHAGLHAQDVGQEPFFTSFEPHQPSFCTLL